MKLKIEKVSRR